MIGLLAVPVAAAQCHNVPSPALRAFLPDPGGAVVAGCYCCDVKVTAFVAVVACSSPMTTTTTMAAPAPRVPTTLGAPQVVVSRELVDQLGTGLVTRLELRLMRDNSTTEARVGACSIAFDPWEGVFETRMPDRTVVKTRDAQLAVHACLDVVALARTATGPGRIVANEVDEEKALFQPRRWFANQIWCGVTTEARSRNRQ